MHKPRARVIKAIAIAAIALDAEMPDTRMRAFDELLAEFDEELVAAAFLRLGKTWKPEFGRKFPVPADVIEMLQAKPSDAELELEAGAAYGRALTLTRYDPESGTTTDVRAVSEQLGPAAAHALRMCGGDIANRDAMWATKTWVKAYAGVRRERPLEFPKLGPTKRPQIAVAYSAETQAEARRIGDILAEQSL